MPTTSACPHCDKKLKMPDGAEGRKLRCPGCHSTLVITEDGLVPLDEEVKEVEETSPPRKGRHSREDDDDEDGPRRSRRRRQEEDEEEEERPRRRSRKRKGGIPLWVWLTGGGVLAAGLLILVLVLLRGGGIGGSKFDKVKVGMTEKEVTDLLGPPDPIHEHEMFGSKSVVWHQGRKALAVTFSDGKVTSVKQADGKPEPGGGMRWDFK